MATHSTVIDLFRRRRVEVTVSTGEHAMPTVTLRRPGRGGEPDAFRLDELAAALRFAHRVLDGQVEPDVNGG